MTKEEQIQKAKEYNLGVKSRDEFKSEIINSINSKFELGPYDYWSEEGKKRKKEEILGMAKQFYDANLHLGMSKDEAKSDAIKTAKQMFKQTQSILSNTYPLMIWTLVGINVEELVSECTNKVTSECNSEITPCFFDAKVGTVQEFNQIVSKAKDGDVDVIVVLNYTYAQGDLWRLLFAYFKENSTDEFFMIASSPLEPEDGVKTNWDRGLSGMVLQSVLLSE